MTHQTIETELVDSVLLVTLARPSVRNAINGELLTALRAAMAVGDRDEQVEAVVLTGAGSSFCAGLDLAELGKDVGLLELAVDRADGRPGMPWDPISKPVIGAINGPAITGGFEIVLYCDMAVASDRAVFQDTHATIGVMPAWGLTARLAARVGFSAARRISLTGQRVSAPEAFRMGLVLEVVNGSRLLETALALAATVAGDEGSLVRRVWETYMLQESNLLREALAIEARASRNSRSAVPSNLGRPPG